MTLEEGKTDNKKQVVVFYFSVKGIKNKNITTDIVYGAIVRKRGGFRFLTLGMQT